MARRNLPLLCPSASIDAPRAKVLGVPTPDGGLLMAREPIPVTPEFIAAAKGGRDPGKRFRFTSPCVRESCQQWKGGRCGVADVVTDELASATPATDAAATPSEGLPPCPIRSSCRWFVQRGADACKACPSVVTNLFTAADVDPFDAAAEE